MAIAVFGKTMENVRKYRYITLVATDSRSNYLLSKPKYLLQQSFFRKSMSIRNEKKVFINKPIYSGLSIVEKNKVVIYADFGVIR